jgi:hypothetical protein
MRPGLDACCALTSIARSGGTDRVRFVNDAAELRASLDGIFASLAP